MCWILLTEKDLAALPSSTSLGKTTRSERERERERKQEKEGELRKYPQ